MFGFSPVSAAPVSAQAFAYFIRHGQGGARSGGLSQLVHLFVVGAQGGCRAGGHDSPFAFLEGGDGLVWPRGTGPIASTLEKEVEDNRVYKFDWNLFAEFIFGETITAATVACEPSGLMIGMPVVVPSQNLVMVRISGGSLGVTYALKCIVMTSGGDILSQTGKLAVTN